MGCTIRAGGSSWAAQGSGFLPARVECVGVRNQRSGIRGQEFGCKVYSSGRRGVALFGQEEVGTAPFGQEGVAGPRKVKLPVATIPKH